jgi:hypothetical protein
MCRSLIEIDLPVVHIVNGVVGDVGDVGDGDHRMLGWFFPLIVHYTIDRNDGSYLDSIFQEYAWKMDRWFEFVYMENPEVDALPPLLEILGPDQYAILALDPGLIQAFEDAHQNEGFSVHVGSEIWDQFNVPIEWQWTR